MLIKKAISTYNLLSFFAQLSQSLTAPEHKEAENIPVITNTKACIFAKIGNYLYMYNLNFTTPFKFK